VREREQVERSAWTECGRKLGSNWLNSSQSLTAAEPLDLPGWSSSLRPSDTIPAVLSSAPGRPFQYQPTVALVHHQTKRAVPQHPMFLGLGHEYFVDGQAIDVDKPTRPVKEGGNQGNGRPQPDSESPK